MGNTTVSDGEYLIVSFNHEFVSENGQILAKEDPAQETLALGQTAEFVWADQVPDLIIDLECASVWGAILVPGQLVEGYSEHTEKPWLEQLLEDENLVELAKTRRAVVMMAPNCCGQISEHHQAELKKRHPNVDWLFPELSDHCDNRHMRRSTRMVYLNDLIKAGLIKSAE